MRFPVKFVAVVLEIAAITRAQFTDLNGMPACATRIKTPIPQTNRLTLTPAVARQHNQICSNAEHSNQFIPRDAAASSFASYPVSSFPASVGSSFYPGGTATATATGTVTDARGSSIPSGTVASGGGSGSGSGSGSSSGSGSGGGLTGGCSGPCGATSTPVAGAAGLGRFDVGLRELGLAVVGVMFGVVVL
ncbi:MAG: hypothetical protein M1820_009615 [Bogoriella megaspora]|nr:MAG: hypothetical protein M1820_009615 [Bogoriella megaspora]